MSFWYLVTTKLKSELRVKRYLEEIHNLETFFPVYPPKKRNSPIGLPLFARYVFVNFDVERDYSKIQYTPGVSRVVSFGSEIIPVPDDVIMCLKSRCDAQDRIKPPNLATGQRVRVKEGIFEGCEGIIQETRANRRIQLLLELAYGPAMRIELDASQVELS